MLYRLTLGLILCAQCTYAQGVVTFRDDFNDNKHEWAVGSDELADVSIEGGSYVITHKNENSYYIRNSHFIDPSRDYTVEAVMTQTAGPTDVGFGLVWNALGEDYSTYLKISGYNGYGVSQYEGEEFTALVPWGESDAVRPIGNPNKLQVVKTVDKVSFRVNGTEVCSLPSTQMFGTNIGFYVQDTVTVKVDYIEVRQAKKPEINMVPGLAKGFVKENLGPNVNSVYSELSPLISADGNTLFMGRDAPDNIGADSNYQDSWYSQRLPDGTWGVRRNTGRPINTESNTCVVGLLPDNNTALCLNEYNQDGSIKGGGFSLSHKTSTGWTLPTTISLDRYKNKSDFVEVGLGPSNSVLVIAAECDTTYGGRDLYVTFKRDDGTWTQPMNVGPSVNTPAEDMSPFLAADNMTLYFSTRGRPGYGSNDIFLTRRLDDSWRNWSEPQNLGPEINSGDWDAYFSVPASGEYAYLCSWTNSLGKSDIFRIKLPDAVKPIPVFLVSGRTFNAKTKKPIEAVIRYEILPEGTDVGSAASAPETGEYAISLARGRQYGFRAEKAGFFPISDNLDARKLDKYSEVKKDLYLVPVEVGEVIRINNVFFDFAKASLREESYSDLNRVVGFLEANPSVEIELAGHTDNVGGDAANSKLSEDRIASVRSYLVSKHISADRLTAKGFGETKPIATNDTDEGRQMNRRVEFKIVKK